MDSTTIAYICIFVIILLSLPRPVTTATPVKEAAAHEA